jgi:hypothetical protein
MTDEQRELVAARAAYLAACADPWCPVEHGRTVRAAYDRAYARVYETVRREEERRGP